MALMHRIKSDAIADDQLVWKFPGEEIRIGSQLIVNQSQEAIFVKGGQALDVFGPGTHTLSTANIPLLSKLINLPFGGQTPFTAEIWFVYRTVKRDLRWGTPMPIQLFDRNLGFPVSVRAFGKWGIRIEDSRAFVAQIVGSMASATSDKVHSYLIGEITQKLNSVLARAIAAGTLGALTISASANELSSQVAEAVQAEFGRYGVALENFNIESINIPSAEMARIQDVFNKKMEVEQLSQVRPGKGYTTVKTFETLKAAAENPGDAGGIAGAMLGAGIGVGAGFPLGNQMASAMGGVSGEAKGGEDAHAKLKLLKQMLDEGLIDEDQYRKKQLEIMEGF
jgi:membrane protease subunit (stomatin/prohibitin family)